MSTDQAIRDHQIWLKYLQPDGLVVSPAALVDAQAILNVNVAPLQQKFQSFLENVGDEEDDLLAVRDPIRFFREFLEWPDDRLVGQAYGRAIPDELKAPLREFGETLEPDAAFCDTSLDDPNRQWLLLLRELPLGTDLDAPVESVVAGWTASHTRRFERLLREVGVPIGLMTNQTQFRLLYAPRGENAGNLTFPVSAMTEVAGRPILAGFEMLFSRYRLLAAPSEARLPGLLKRSRDYQSRVSTALAAQVLDALYEMLRGFEAANQHSRGELMKQILAEHPDQVYTGLLTVLMRLVFLLYAEDRGLMPGSDLYVRHYAVHGLFERLRNDAQHYPDTMDHRYGAWAQLVALFRAVHDGCEHRLMSLPARYGHLFDPDRFLFLEGRTTSEARLPLVSDGIIHRILEKLLILDGERLSYRTLDVEQIGSVYETMMGFRLQQAQGQTVALKPAKAHGAPVPIDLDELLKIRSDGREKWIIEKADYKLTANAKSAVMDAESIDGLLAALEGRIARNATPQPVSSGTMVLIPTEERRRTGSHYTPRSFTEPIVRTTLKPILDALGDNPTPDQILSIKVCDKAMGSGAFLVESCRQIADELVKAWVFHGWKPMIPPDEDAVLHARRIVAQRCLYGVDRNPMAVDLAKLSLWLATLAKDHPFTFLDHCLRCGDSLVGLTRDQIVSFHWQPSRQTGLIEEFVEKRLKAITKDRGQIIESGDDMPPTAKRQKLDAADKALDPIRLIADAAVSAFFSQEKAKDRQKRRESLLEGVEDILKGKDSEAARDLVKAVQDLRSGERPVIPFHWEIEFPEVFSGDEPGFDGIVGNPPFLGGRRISGTIGDAYKEWLVSLHDDANANSDIVAHFYRRAFSLLRAGGTFGLIATNTISQGDTRATGLRWICTHGGTIYNATRRVKWPGMAAVVVSVVHVMKETSEEEALIAAEPGLPYGSQSSALLDNRPVPRITAFLFHAGGHENPMPLLANAGKSFQGSIVLGMGFTFDDTDTKGVASPIAEMHRLIEKDSRNRERIFPYIGGEEVNTSPTLAHHRYVINFWDMTEEDARRWPDLMGIVEAKVKPERMLVKREAHKKYWWRYGDKRPELYSAIRGMERVLGVAQTSNTLAFAFQPGGTVFGHTLVVFPSDGYGFFGVLQSRIHQTWALFFAAKMKDDARYIPSDCFETFPFPESTPLLHPLPQGERRSDGRGSDLARRLEQVGQEYYDFRAQLMIKNDEGLTKTYNRFHDPNEVSPDILKLRDLHGAMDRAVLEAYGWTDIDPRCDFILDYEEDEEEDGGRNRKKPYRYRWVDEVRDEVLARLMALNAERAAEERRTGEVAAAKQRGKGAGRGRKQAKQCGDS